MAHIHNRGKTSRYRARLKAKHKKQRARKAGELRVRKPGGRMKPASRR